MAESCRLCYGNWRRRLNCARPIAGRDAHCIRTVTFKKMRRYQLFEFLDQEWLPASLRTALTRYLTAAYKTTEFPRLWAEIIARVLDECGETRIVDIGSGSGGPMALVICEMEQLGQHPRVTLTDLYPGTSNSGIDYWPQPVDATQVPAQLPGLRTLFLTFHHFAPTVATAVLRDAFEERQAICIFEATSRTLPAIALSLLIPFLVMAVTPAIRPVSAFQIFFTYLVPVLPLMGFWDGLVSQLRTYSMAEFQEFTAGFQSPDYAWECGVAEPRQVPFKTCYLIGRPR
jgi:hypothetical protein